MAPAGQLAMQLAAAGARARSGGASSSRAARELHREHWRGLRLAESGGRLRAREGDGSARGPDARRDVRRARARAGGGAALKGAEWRANKLTASEYDEATWSERTFMAFTTQRLSVAVQYSAAQEVAEALGLSVAADPRAAP
eukprot:scaffold8402_cov63-Phaeocystis_antarctica.AAC.3